MFRKLTVGFMVLVLLLIAAGCGGSKETTAGGDKDEAVIAFVAMTTTSPHALVNQKSNIIAEQLTTLGKDVRYISTRSLDNVYPLLDKGEPDFFYLPHSAFTTYITETSKFGGSNDYAIIAGSLNINDVQLVVRPEIESLKDLDGKKVGIANLRYSDDFQLNKVLNTIGLASSSVGGTVEVVWDDIVGKTLENYSTGNYSAVCIFNSDNVDSAVKKVPGSKVYSLNPDGLFSEIQPRVWLIAKKEVIKNDPELVKAILKAHVLSTDKAESMFAELPALNQEVHMQYFKDKGVDLSSQNKVEKYEERWKTAGITYDPNMSYINGLWDYMDKKGVVKGKTLEDFVRIEFLNEVLKEMGKPPVADK